MRRILTRFLPETVDDFASQLSTLLDQQPPFEFLADPFPALGLNDTSDVVGQKLPHGAGVWEDAEHEMNILDTRPSEIHFCEKVNHLVVQLLQAVLDRGNVNLCGTNFQFRGGVSRKVFIVDVRYGARVLVFRDGYDHLQIIFRQVSFLLLTFLEIPLKTFSEKVYLA